MTKTTRSFYRLRHADGRIVMLEEYPNQTDDCCNATTIELSMHGEREARFDTIEAVQRALSVETPWYNSTTNRPTWGGLDTSAMTAEHVTEILETTITPQPSADIRLPVWNDRYHLSDVRASILGFSGDPITIKTTHRIVSYDMPTTIDPATLIGRDFFLRDRRVHGVALVTYADCPALLIDVDA